ncbi:hypothetical protein BHM03_00019842 [Ensete ventricosum]|nr:hypothetical protein BHM03_00019842 [Ensete ventricosum]
MGKVAPSSFPAPEAGRVAAVPQSEPEGAALYDLTVAETTCRRQSPIPSGTDPFVQLPVCARPPASQSLRHKVKLVRMSGDSGLDVGGLMLEWGSPGEEGVVPLGSAVGSCKEVGSGRFPT